MDRSAVARWLSDYERVWRTPGTDAVRELFTDDATYLPSPWADVLTGPALNEFWDAERVSPDEHFEMHSSIVAVDGNTAVVRVEVDYVKKGGRWRDLWIIEFADDGRCIAFEEWPFAPLQRNGH